MKMSNISLCGFYGFNNYGDSLMLENLKTFFNSFGLRVKIFSDRESEESFSFKTLNPNSSDIVALGGGGIITKNFWYIKTELYKELRDDQKLILINVNLTQESVPVLEILGDRDKVILASDISFLSQDKKPYNQKSNKVSVCLNYYIFKDFFSSNERNRIYAKKAIIELAEFIKWLRTFNYKIQLVPCQVDKEVNDNTVHGILNAYIGGADNWIYSNEYFESNINHSSLIISARYHSTLFAIKNAIPFVDITHHSKNSNLLKDLNLENLSVNYWKISLEDLKKKAFEAQNSSQILETSLSYGVSSRENWEKVSNKIHTLIQ